VREEEALPDVVTLAFESTESIRNSQQIPRRFDYFQIVQVVQFTHSFVLYALNLVLALQYEAEQAREGEERMHSL
jgi:hypothetical protein